MWCSVTNCSCKKDMGFHVFPKCPILLEKWINFCGRNKKINPKTARICSEHFVEDDFENNLKFKMGFSKKRILKSNAVPSVGCKKDKLKGGMNDSCILKDDIEIKEEILDFVPCGSDNIESLCWNGIKKEVEEDPLHPFHEGNYYIQCKCSVLVQRSNKSTQCNLYEEEKELYSSSVSYIKHNSTAQVNDNNSDKSLNAKKLINTLVQKKTVQNCAKKESSYKILLLKITSDEKQLDSELNLPDYQEGIKIKQNLAPKEGQKNILSLKSHEITNDEKLFNANVNDIYDNSFAYSSFSDSSENILTSKSQEIDGKLINANLNNIQDDPFAYSSFSDSSDDEDNFDNLIPMEKSVPYKEYCTKVDGGFKCHKCDIVVAGINHFVGHLEHSKLCWVCGRIFNKINSHIKFCSDNMHNTKLTYKRRENPTSHICQTCGKKSKTKIQANDHQNIHDNVKPYQCSCGTVFRFFENFIAHCRKFKCSLNHCEIPYYAPQNIQPWLDKNNLRMEKLKQRRSQANKQQQKEKDKRHRRKFPDVELTCKPCGIDKFLNYVAYRKHFENIHIERTFVCKDKRCEKKLATQRLLREHIKQHHIIKYKCDKCNIVLSLSKYKSHIKRNCINSNKGEITVSNYRKNFRNRLFYCKICSENEIYFMAKKHFIEKYHQDLEKNWKEKFNIKEFKCSKCPTKNQRCFSKIDLYLIHLEKEHNIVFVKHINDIFTSLENHQPFILNDAMDIE